MRLNLQTKELFTDDGKFIKKMHCPKRVQWDEMERSGFSHRTCAQCEKKVHDTSVLSEDEVVALVENDPKTCLRVNLNQINLKDNY